MIVRETDFVLVYAKRLEYIKIVGLPLSDKDSKIYDMDDELGLFLFDHLDELAEEIGEKTNQIYITL